uniref:Uncharacterized protein n=1 Tax=Panagrolaimus sp. ES5 TaxID=591445 RepID=A0AC34FRH4_9BILA
MLPADLFNKNISPPFVILPGDNVVLPAEMTHGALTPQKRATTEQHSNFPVAKRLQLIHEACNDLSSGTSPVSLDNNNIFNYSVNNSEQIENSGDPNNIAGTPAFITTLMKFIKFSDEQRQGSIDNIKMAQQKYPSITTTPTAMSPKDASACANQAIWSADSYEGKKVSSSNSKLPSISNACENSMITSHNSLPSMNQIIPNKSDLCASDTEDCVFDDDDCLLNNLPTSVDDLQDMEKQIKMERHFSSPLMSHRHTPSNYDPGRLSAASGVSFVFDGALSAASNPPDEELDADDLEVAMINESFEEQQRQYKLYCGDKLKSAFYSAPEDTYYGQTVEHEPRIVYPITVPENEEPLYTNDSLYCQWKEESPSLSSTYDTIAKPIVNDIFNNIIPALDDEEDSIAKSTLASLHPSIPESMDSLKLYNTSSLRSDISPPQSSFNSGEDSFVDPEEDAIATVLSSAKFVLEEMDSPEMAECESPLLMKPPPKNAFETEIPPSSFIEDIKSNSDESEDEAELVSAWKEIKHSGTTGDNVRYYFPRNHATPLPPPLLDKIEMMIEEPPKNIKALAHVTEIYDPNGEIDTEPALQYFQFIGMKNFYQREIDIQRAFLIFPNVNDAKFAVDNNKTGLQLRLLEESPQFVKLKALKMYSELRPCCYDSPAEPHLTEMCKPWQSLSEPIAGV